MLVFASLLHIVAISSSDPVGAVDFLAKRACSGEVTGTILRVFLASFWGFFLARSDVVDVGLYMVSRDEANHFTENKR